VRRNPVDKSQSRNATLKIALTLRIVVVIRVCAAENFNRAARRKNEANQESSSGKKVVQDSRNNGGRTPQRVVDSAAESNSRS